MKQLIKVLGLSLFLLVLTNCNNKSSNDTTSYRWVNGLCYNNQNQQVATTNCGTLVNGNTNYYFNANGQCVDRASGQLVVSTLCSNTTGTFGSQQCIGQYVYYNQQYMQYVNVNCGTQNSPPSMYICSGQTLFTTAGQQVNCL